MRMFFLRHCRCYLPYKTVSLVRLALSTRTSKGRGDSKINQINSISPTEHGNSDALFIYFALRLCFLRCSSFILILYPSSFTFIASKIKIYCWAYYCHLYHHIFFFLLNDINTMPLPRLCVYARQADGRRLRIYFKNSVLSFIANWASFCGYSTNCCLFKIGPLYAAPWIYPLAWFFLILHKMNNKYDAVVEKNTIYIIHIKYYINPLNQLLRSPIIACINFRMKALLWLLVNLSALLSIYILKMHLHLSSFVRKMHPICFSLRPWPELTAFAWIRSWLKEKVNEWKKIW